MATQTWMGIGIKLEKTGEPMWLSVFCALLLMFLSRLLIFHEIWKKYLTGEVPDIWSLGTWGFVITLTIGFFLNARKYSSWRKLLKNRRILQQMQKKGIIDEYTMEKSFRILFVNVMLHNIGSIPKNKEDFDKLMSDKNFWKLADEITTHKISQTQKSNKK